jgi:hypothetical protein
MDVEASGHYQEIANEVAVQAPQAVGVVAAD